MAVRHVLVGFSLLATTHLLRSLLERGAVRNESLGPEAPVAGLSAPAAWFGTNYLPSTAVNGLWWLAPDEHLAAARREFPIGRRFELTVRQRGFDTSEFSLP